MKIGRKKIEYNGYNFVGDHCFIFVCGYWATAKYQDRARKAHKAAG